MNSSQLRAYEDAEWARIETIVRDHVGKWMTPRMCFPELSLSPPYATTNISPFWCVLPFYETMIYGVGPFPSAEAMYATHGVTVRELMHLREQGRIELLLASQPLAYRGLAYLDPILALRPPSWGVRTLAFLSCLASGDDLAAFAGQAKQLFLGRLGTRHSQLGRGISQQSYEGSVITAYLHMKALGYGRLVDLIVRDSSSMGLQRELLLELYYDLLCAPAMVALDGVNVTDGERFGIGDALTPGLRVPGNRRFPVEVARMLTERLELVRPDSLRAAMQVHADYREARHLLHALEDYVEKGGFRDVRETTVALGKVFSEVAAMHRRRSSFETAYQVLGVVGAAAAGLAGGWLGLFAGLGFGLVSGRLVAPGIDRLAAAGKASHLIALYRFQSSAGR